ncbi:MAG: zinc-binding dehydrogenase [Leptolyngbya sp. SIO1E4]|nr:zinc-binding dehydrogenase [Leptolyngbya sp. SIO1E4]
MVITQHGDLDVLAYQDYPDPVPGAQDLLVRVHATSLNPVDCKVRRASRVPRQFPLILGYDVSGTVVAVGDRVSGFKVGDEVYASPSLMRNGANAEYVTVDSRSAALKPATLDHASAAVLPLVSLTAWEALDLRANLQPGQTVLIHAGAGGVGHIAIQLAKLRGCFVITTAGREESIQFCRDHLHADVVIDYRHEDFAAKVMDITSGKGCPTILDTVGDDVFLKSLDCVAINGQIVTILPTATNLISEKLFLKNVTLHYEFMGVPTVYNLNPERQGTILSALGNLVDAGLIAPRISRRMQLFESLAEGHRLQETGHTLGKISVMVR